MTTRILTALVAVFCPITVCLGQTATSSALSPATRTSTPSQAGDSLTEKFNAVNFDRAPSAVPAFDALGLSPESVTSPSTPRELAGDLLNSVDQNGVLQHGLAIETAPFRLLGIRTNLGDYKTGAITRWVYNFSVSAATSKAVDKSDAVQLALGFKEVLYESADHDPYRNQALSDAFEKAAGQVDLSDDYDKPGSQLPTIPKTASDVFNNAVTEFYKNKWQGAIWTAAMAPTWNSNSGKIGELTGTGYTTWTAFAYGLHQNKQRPLQIGALNEPINVQFIGEVRYREGEQVTDPNNKARVVTQNTFLAAGRLRIGADSFNGFVEGGYVSVWHGLNGDGDGMRVALGAEKKIAKNVWLVLSAGEQFGEAGAKTNNLFAISSLRFGTADKAQFSPE